MSLAEHDVVIVGGGHNGLACAAYLAKAGLGRGPRTPRCPRRSGRYGGAAFTQYGPFELREGSWDTERDVYAKRVIDELERHAPGLPDVIEHIEVLTPKDLEVRYGLLGGNIMQGELTPDQMFSFRPIPFYGDHRTPSKGSTSVGAERIRGAA